MKAKLTLTQGIVLETLARAAGRPRSFEGGQLRAATGLCEQGLIERKGRSMGYTLTKAGEDYAREAGWLKVSPPAPPTPAVSVSQVLDYQLKEQHARTLRTAEELLGEVEQWVARLRDGSVPSAAINPNTFAFLIADHAKLVTLRDTLEVVDKAD